VVYDDDADNDETTTTMIYIMLKGCITTQPTRPYTITDTTAFGYKMGIPTKPDLLLSLHLISNTHMYSVHDGHWLTKLSK